jgi:uncharacterized iron-regulated membrane protein
MEMLRASAAKAFPNWRELRLHAPRETVDDHGRMGPRVWRAEAVLAETPHEHGRSIAWLDPRSAEILRIDPFSALPSGARWRALARPIHDGTILGRASQWVAFLAVLAAPVLSVTGVALWWLRRRARQAQRKCAALGVRKIPPVPGRVARPNALPVPEPTLTALPARALKEPAAG